MNVLRNECNFNYDEPPALEELDEAHASLLTLLQPPLETGMN